ncbi:kelch-like protein 26 [Ptychodera flava]|uniref:kelch-like protein 26 n=1 Tax=Ptychodera flava TaxID=63121 RepID=UPI00396A7CEC
MSDKSKRSWKTKIKRGERSDVGNTLDSKRLLDSSEMENESGGNSCRCSSTSRHATDVLRSMAEMWKQKQLNDVVLVVGKHRFGAHKLVLAACSGYFRRIFAENSALESEAENQFVCTLHGISYRAVEALLESMYMARLNVDGQNVEELLHASHYLQVPFALNVCSEHIKRNLTVESCLRTLALVSNLELVDLEETTLKLAAETFSKVSDLEDFLLLPYEPLKKLLCRDDIIVDSELQVFKALVKWMEYDRRRRTSHSVSLLECVRLPMIKPCDIVDHVEPVAFLMNIAECEALVKEALHYHCLPLRQSILQSSRTTPRSIIKMSTVVTLGGHPRRSKDSVSKTVRYFNPDSKEWRYLTEMGHPLHHHAVAVLGGFLYVAGGRHTTDRTEHPTDRAHRYDPRTNSWIEIASMKNKRESFQLGVLDGMLYAVGGRIDDSTSLADVEKYNPYTDKWETISPLSDPRRSVAVATHNGRLYAMGGSGNRRISNKVERYNPKTKKWETKRPLSTPRFFALLVSASKNLFLAGGATVDQSGNLQCVDKVERYECLTDTWTSLANMLTPRAEAACTVHDGKIYVVGGYSWDSNTWLDSVECYDTAKDEWTVMKSIPKPYTGIACCTLVLHKLP